MDSQNYLPKKYGELIRKIRTERGMTQAELAKRANVSEIAIRKYENNTRTPKFNTIGKITNALSVSLIDFMHEADSMPLLSDSETIKELRKSYNLTVEDFANKAGISADTLIAYEEDKTEIPVEILKHILEIFPINRNIRKSPLLSESMLAWRRYCSGEPISNVTIPGPFVLLDTYNILNNTGKKEAFKRLKELTRLEEYTKPDAPGSPSDSDTSARMSDQVAADEPEPGSRKE